MTVSTLPSRIKSVTVYRTDAAVTRVSEIDLSDTSMPDEVQIVGLPLGLEDASLTATIEPVGDGSVPEACDVRVGLDVPEPDDDLPPPQNEQLRNAERVVSELEAQITQLDLLVTKFKELQAPDRPKGERGKAPPPAPTAARLALLEFREGELESLGIERKALLTKLEEARDALVVLQRRDQAASTARQAREEELRKSVSVRLRKTTNEPAASACRLMLEYLVPGARWVPSYAIRFSSDEDFAELAMRAQLCQDTGEDWKNVELRVATADPERWSELPDLPALRIGRQQPTLLKTGWRPAPTGADELFADYDRVADSVEPAEEDLEDGGSRSIFSKEFLVRENAVLDDLVEAEGFTGAAPEEESNTGEHLAQSPSPEPAPELRSPPPPTAALSTSGIVTKAARIAPHPIPGAAKAVGVHKDMSAPMADAEARTELTAATDMLNYSKLRLRGVSDSDRGLLRPLTQEEGYLEHLTRVHVSVDIDLTVAVGLASMRATNVAGKPPPHGYVAPKSWNGFDYSYAADTAVSVPSDANFHNVPLSTHSGKVELRYVTVPREGLEVYRFMDLTNPLQTPLPEGPADVYMDGDYLLTSLLHTVSPDGTIELGLGVEEGLKVSRNTRFSERTSGLLGGNLGLSHEIVVELANNMSTDADVEIRERVPTVREGDDEVSVEVTTVDPPWEPFDQDRRQVEGAYRWRLDVPSGATRTLKADYEISLSAKHEIVGGNRREE